MRYNINLVAELRASERKRRNAHMRITIVTTVLACLLAFVAVKWVGGILSMRQSLANAQGKLAQLQQEYQRYQATNLSITKEDVELLDRLQHGRIFWSKKLASLASPLPANYWVDAMGYKKEEMRVRGFGYIDSEQRQLLTLDGYLNILRGDTVFSKGIKTIALNETRRNDDEDGIGKRQRVSFEYSAKSLPTNIPVAAAPSSASTTPADRR